MSLEKNKNLACKFLTELYSKWQFDVIDEIIHDNYKISERSVSVIHLEESMPPGPGKQELKKRVQYFRKAMPNMRYTILKLIAEDDSVMAWWTWEGTQEDELFGFSPNYKSMKIFGTNLFKIKDGKILSTSVSFDTFSLLIQLGHVQIDQDQDEFIMKYLEKLRDLKCLH
ncbi:MAG: ester cyclase [Candidatus Heimdallarchaeota archaeon]|nr:ester cyclase [Candidatus Heimdallarchaeota archaeon]